MISLDHYVGREVIGVEEAEEGGWQINLEGDVRIICFDAQYDMPDADTLTGMKLTQTIFSKSETRLWFGTSDNPEATTMFLPPMDYGISDPARKDIEDQPVRPQAGPQIPPAEETRPDEPAERIADGPEEAPPEQEAPEEGADKDQDG